MIEVFYFFYFTSVGTYMPFLPAYLRGLGLSGRQISTVLMATPLMALLVPLGWAWVADHTKRHARVLQAVTLGACLGFFPMIFARRYHAIALSWVGYALFSVAIGGLADALAIARMRAGADYGRMRFWGSLGFVVAAVAAGGLLAARGARAADPLVPVMMWLALAATFAAALRLRGTGEQSTRPRVHDIRALLADRRFRLLVIVAPLHWACCTPYNVYFGVFLSDLHQSPMIWGLSFCIGVVAEMAVLLLFRRFRTRLGLEAMMAVTFAASAVRWFATASVHATWALMALQSLHGLTFGLFWGAGIAMVAECVPPALRATGQALFVMSINLGTALGNAGTGVLYDASGASALFLVAGFVELLPLVVVIHARHRLRLRIPVINVPPGPSGGPEAGTDE